MAQGFILAVIGLSSLTSIFSLRAFVLEFRKTSRHMYGTINFENRSPRGLFKLSLITSGILCLISTVLLVFALTIYQFVNLPIL